MASKRGKTVLANELGLFIQKYQRKSQRGREPNDRSYSADTERKLKQLKPEQLSELLTPNEDAAPPPRIKRKQPDPRFVGHVKRKGR